MPVLMQKTLYLLLPIPSKHPRRKLLHFKELSPRDSFLKATLYYYIIVLLMPSLPLYSVKGSAREIRNSGGYNRIVECSLD